MNNSDKSLNTEMTTGSKRSLINEKKVVYAMKKFLFTILKIVASLVIMFKGIYIWIFIVSQGEPIPPDSPGIILSTFLFFFPISYISFKLVFSLFKDITLKNVGIICIIQALCLIPYPTPIFEPEDTQEHQTQSLSK